MGDFKLVQLELLSIAEDARGTMESLCVEVGANNNGSWTNKVEPWMVAERTNELEVEGEITGGEV